MPYKLKKKHRSYITFIPCGLSVGSIVAAEIVFEKSNKYKKQKEKDQKTIKFFGKKHFCKSLEDKYI